jgi:hypothetical protein
MRHPERSALEIRNDEASEQALKLGIVCGVDYLN